MLGQNLSVFKRLHLVIDLGLTLISFHLALLVRGNLVGAGILDPSSMGRPYGLLFFILPIWAFFSLSQARVSRISR